MIIDKLNPLRALRWQRLKSRSGKRNKQISYSKIIAVTGSAGKTTTAHLLHHILSYGGKNTGLISTSGIWANGKQLDPDFVVNVASEQELNTALVELSKQGMDLIIVEAPAGLIAQKRFFGMTFDSLILTNIGGGDFARDFVNEEEYAQTIFSLLHQVTEEGMAVLNADDDSSEWIAINAERIKQNIYAAWSSKQQAEDLEITLTGTRFKYSGGFFETKTISQLYLENTLQAIMLASKYVGLDSVDAALNSYRGLAGREQILKMQPTTILVDYAYQPIVIDMLLSDIRSSIPKTSRIITILGAAGQRGDSRKQVGIPAVKYSDIVMLAPQDPRGEDVVTINTRIAELTESYGGVLVERFIDMQEYETIPKDNLNEKINRVMLNSDVPIISFDSNSPVGRYNAVDYALELSKPGDVVAILGKGDDDVMDFGDTLYEWSDEKAVRDVLDNMIETEISPGIGTEIN